MIQEFLEGDYYGGGSGGQINNQETPVVVVDESGSNEGTNVASTPSLPQVLVKQPYEAPIAPISEPISVSIDEEIAPVPTKVVTTQPVVAPIAQVSEPIALPVENLGSSIINPSPIDTLPVKVPIEEVKEPTPTATPIVNVPTTEPIAKEAVTVPKEQSTSNIAPAPVDTVAKTTLNIIPLMMPNLSPASGSGSSDATKKTNPTYWLYVIAGAVVVSYFLLKGKPKQN